MLHGSAGAWFEPVPGQGACDADGLRASELEHAVQGQDSDSHLGGPTRDRARAQRVADHPLVAAIAASALGLAW